MKNFFNFAALAGASIALFASLAYLHGLLDWGMRNHWHFMYVGGWGARFLHYLQIMILALFVWSLSRLSRYDVYRMLDVLFLVGVVLFVLASILETVVAKFYP